jgi:hypothetical protein
MSKIVGTCSCSSINFEIDTTTIVKTVNCHCSLCRKMNGSAFSSYVVIKESGYKLISGQDNVANYKRSQNATKSFCQLCGTPIYNSNHTQYPSLKILYLGTLENADQINIDANIFCDTRLDCVKGINKIPSFKETTHSEIIND